MSEQLAGISPHVLLIDVTFSLPCGFIIFVYRVLTYHNVGDTPTAGLVNLTNTGVFERQLDELSSKWRIPTDGQPGGEGRNPDLIITVDDGFEDCYRVIYPVMRKRRLTFSLFVATAFLDSGRAPWPNELRYILMTTRRTQLLSPMAASLSTLAQREAVCAELKRELLTWDPLRRYTLLNEMKSEMLGNEPMPFRPVTWDQVREMSAAGVTIGSHTTDHSALACVSASVRMYELEHSKRRIEDELGRPCTTIAYPNGSWNHDVVKDAATIGYKQGFTQDPGANIVGCDSLRVRRINIPPSDSPSRCVSRTRLCGLTNRAMLMQAIFR